jgi:hypothetical protein
MSRHLSNQVDYVSHAGRALQFHLFLPGARNRELGGNVSQPCTPAVETAPRTRLGPTQSLNLRRSNLPP